jgi:hypothetical protein
MMSRGKNHIVRSNDYNILTRALVLQQVSCVRPTATSSRQRGGAHYRPGGRWVAMINNTNNTRAPIW